MDTKHMVIKKYDIVQVNLDGTMGSEQGKTRPCIVIQNDIGNHFSPTCIIATLTSCIKNLRMPTHTLIEKNEENGLSVDSMFLGEQIRTVDKMRIKYKIGHIYDKNIQKNIKSAYLSSFDL
jgi:mRNA interferase MazF